MERRGEADDAAGGNGRDKDVSVDKVVASGLRAGGGTIAGAHEAAAPVWEGPERSSCHGRGASRVIIIDERSFRRESVVRLLREVSPDCTFLALARPTDLAETSVGNGLGAQCAADADVVILDIGWTRLPDRRIEDDIRFIHEWLGDVPIILLSDREDGAHVAEALRHGFAVSSRPACAPPSWSRPCGWSPPAARSFRQAR